MGSEVSLLVGTAAVLGFTHTLLGPDHYLPFIVMARTGKWSMRKTALITFLCGVGHVGSSVVLGFLGVAVGLAVAGLQTLEAVRGEIAAWLLLAFGFTYMVWGLHRAIRNKPHQHAHMHPEEEHAHAHGHDDEHMHVHPDSRGRSMTPWILFTIFVFGPCEPLIPLLIYPAAEHNTAAVVQVAAVFSAITIAMMMTIVLVASAGIGRLHLGRLERYSHALAGFAVFACGAGIKWLGL